MAINPRTGKEYTFEDMNPVMIGGRRRGRSRGRRKPGMIVVPRKRKSDTSTLNPGPPRTPPVAGPGPIHMPIGRPGPVKPTQPPSRPPQNMVNPIYTGPPDPRMNEPNYEALERITGVDYRPKKK